jgi:hypothetical protein
MSLLPFFRRPPKKLAAEHPYDINVPDFWIDHPEAEKLIDKYVPRDEPELRAAVAKFISQGFTVLPAAVSHAVIDQYLAEFEQGVQNGGFIMSHPAKGYAPYDPAERYKPLTKVLDLYVKFPVAVDLVFAPMITRFLWTVFQVEPMAFQGLHFEVGSTQDVHNDSAYVVVENNPLHFIASWIALEDIEEGSGELVYYPGSHKLKDYLYQGKFKNWNAERDGNENHKRHLAYLHEESKRLGLKLEAFRPRKGDVLLWHANLAHGGGPITRPQSTRRSHVTHYCPVTDTPHYFNYLPPERKVKRQVKAGCHVSSLFYEIPKRLSP